ncbi:MAG: hypothetical protein AB1651_06930 [Pseudomonadota bacterium]
MFAHEAAAVDPRTNHVYETQDKSDGRFYRSDRAGVLAGRPAFILQPPARPRRQCPVRHRRHHLLRQRSPWFTV